MLFAGCTSSNSLPPTSAPTTIATGTAANCELGDLYRATGRPVTGGFPRFSSVDCRADYATFVAGADPSTCTTGGVCPESERAFLKAVDGAWTLLDMGAGVDCRTSTNVSVAAACAALAPDTTSAALHLGNGGGCGVVGFDALDAAGTTHLAVYINLGQHLGEPQDTRFAVGEPTVQATLQRGFHLQQYSGCNDFIIDARIDTLTSAVAGGFHLVAVATDPAKPLDCGNVTSTLDVTGLQFADGTRIADSTLGSLYIDCFGG